MPAKHKNLSQPRSRRPGIKEKFPFIVEFSGSQILYSGDLLTLSRARDPRGLFGLFRLPLVKDLVDHWPLTVVLDFCFYVLF